MTWSGSIASLERSLRLTVVAALVGAHPALAQQLGGAKPLEIPYLQILAGLVLCSLAAFAAVLVLQRRAGRTPPRFQFNLPWLSQVPPAKRPLKVLESQRLSPHADLCRFIAHDREYVVIVTAGAISIVGERAAPVEGGSQHDPGKAA